MSRADERTAVRLMARLTLAREHDLASRKGEHLLRGARGKADLNVRAKLAEACGVELWQ
jgi:hypothetical protein